MKKFIRNLLIGFVSFLPMEKVQADSSENTRDYEAEGRDLLEKLEQGEIESTPVVQADLTELLRLLNEENPVKDQNGHSTNTTPIQVDLSQPEPDKVDRLVLNEKSPVTNAFFEVATVFPKENAVTNTEDFVALTNEMPTLVATPKIFSDSAQVPNDIPEVVTNDSVAITTEPVTEPTNSVISTTTTPVVSKTADVVEEVIPSQTQTVETLQADTFSQVGRQVQPDAVELLSSLGQKDSVSSEKKTVPATDRGWLPYALSVLMVGIFTGFIWLGKKFENRKEKEKRREGKPAFEESAIVSIINEMKKTAPVVSKEPSLPQEKPAQPLAEKPVKKPRKTKQKPVIVNVLGKEAHQKGVKMLANIKIRRSAINRRMKAIRAEMVQYPQSDPRFLKLVNEANVLQEERNTLTRAHRLARTLVKGEEGERIKNERRLVAKEMRLAEQANDTDRFTKALEQHSALKSQDKALVKAAENEAKERLAAADRWHGKRLYHEAITQEKQLNERICRLKKETGLKRAEILELEDDIREGLQKIRHQKSLATRQMKGTRFTNQKRALAKQIIEAHAAQDLNAENQLKEKLQEVKIKEKEYVKWAKAYDYAEARRTVVPPSVQHHAERRDLANVWKGYRMLRDLKQGYVTAVNSQQITEKDYQEKARALIGKNYNSSFNYETERSSCLKPATLASIYLSHKRKGLI